MGQVKLPCFSSIILLLTSTIWVWQAAFDTQASLPIHTSLNKSNFCGHLTIPFFLPSHANYREENSENTAPTHILVQTQKPVELRNSCHTFLAKITKLHPYHPKTRGERLTILEDSMNSPTDFIRMVQSVKNLCCFPPSQASRLTCAICIGWDRGICVIGVAAEAEMVAPAALCCWLAECCTAAASNWACACWSNNCCWAGVNVSYKQLENTAINNGKSHFSYKVIRQLSTSYVNQAILGLLRWLAEDSWLLNTVWEPTYQRPDTNQTAPPPTFALTATYTT